MAKFSEIATVRSKMTLGAQNALNDLDDFLADILEVRSDSIPLNFRNKREDTTSFKMLIRKTAPKPVEYVDPRSVSVKFTAGEITSGTDERIATIEKYRQQFENDGEIEYDGMNDDGEYQGLVNLACEFAKLGILGESDFDTDEEI